MRNGKGEMRNEKGRREMGEGDGKKKRKRKDFPPGIRGCNLNCVKACS